MGAFFFPSTVRWPSSNGHVYHACIVQLLQQVLRLGGAKSKHSRACLWLSIFVDALLVFDFRDGTSERTSVAILNLRPFGRPNGRPNSRPSNGCVQHLHLAPLCAKCQPTKRQARYSTEAQRGHKRQGPFRSIKRWMLSGCCAELPRNPWMLWIL